MDFTRFFLYIQDVVVYSVSLNKKNYFAQNSHKKPKSGGYSHIWVYPPLFIFLFYFNYASIVGSSSTFPFFPPRTCQMTIQAIDTTASSAASAMDTG